MASRLQRASIFFRCTSSRANSSPFQMEKGIKLEEERLRKITDHFQYQLDQKSQMIADQEKEINKLKEENEYLKENK